MDINGFAKKGSSILQEHKHLIALALVSMLALYIRILSLPLVKTYLPDIDTYLFYRGSDYILNNNFHLPVWDLIRNYPFGADFNIEQPLPYYLPAIWYKLVSLFVHKDYWTLIRYYSPIITSLTAIPMYLIGKELKGKWAGIFSAFFFAVLPAIVMRNPAGYIEKEPATLVFMMLSVYFFIRTLKKDSWLSAALMGISLTFVHMGWGGADHLYLAYAIFGGIALFVNNCKAAMIKNYIFIIIPIIVGESFTRYDFIHTSYMLNYGVFALIIIRLGIERFGIVKQESLKYFIPALSGAGLLFILLASMFSPFIAAFVNGANGLLFYDEGTFGGTVAENQRPGFDSFLAQFGFTDQTARYMAIMLSSPKTESDVIQSMKTYQPLFYLSAWIFAFIALVYISYKKEDKYKWAGIIATAIAVISFLLFVNTPGSNLQIIYLLSFFASVLLFARRDDHAATLIAIFLFAGMLGFMSKVRVGYLMGPYIAILAGYFMSGLISRVQNLNVMKNAKTLEEKINVYSVGAGGLIALVLIANLAAGYAIGSSMGPNYNNNWNNAMNFMKYNTSQDSVILSWWDFGYWFQAMSGRATMLDGGNADIYGDKLAGLYFSGRMNETEQKKFLQSRGITHILVDASMIGKYGAMTRIGTDWNEIDQYLQLGQPQQMQKNGNIVLMYPFGQNAFYVSVNPNGTSINNQITQIAFSTPQGNVNLKYFCTEDGAIDLKPKEPLMDGCILFTKYGVFFPTAYNTKTNTQSASTLTGKSIFTKLFFFDGKGIDYVKKVYENDEVKIYEVELPRKTREELINWWYENIGNFTMKDAFVEARLQTLKESNICIKGNDVKKC